MAISQKRFKLAINAANAKEVGKKVQVHPGTVAKETLPL